MPDNLMGLVELFKSLDLGEKETPRALAHGVGLAMVADSIDRMAEAIENAADTMESSLCDGVMRMRVLLSGTPFEGGKVTPIVVQHFPLQDPHPWGGTKH